MIDIVKPLRPTGADWYRMQPPLQWRSSYPAEFWLHQPSGLSVISAVEVVKEPGEPSNGPEYHVSMSLSGERCTSADALWILAQFGMVDAEEDNHVPNGKVRNFWRPVADRLVGIECECKDAEPVIREDKGDFVWRGLTK